MSIQTRQGKGPVTVLGVHWTAKGFPQKVTCEHALQEEQPEGAGREGGRGGGTACLRCVRKQEQHGMARVQGAGGKATEECCK